MAQYMLVFTLIILTLFCEIFAESSSSWFLDETPNVTDVSRFSQYLNAAEKYKYNDADQGEARKKKKKGGKYIIALLFGAVMIKAIIFPLAVKAMAVMSTVSVFISTLSLIVSSIIGYAKLAMKGKHHPVKIIRVHEKQHHDDWAKDDDVLPTKYYALEPVEHDEHFAEAHHYYVA